MVYTTRGGLL